MEELSKQAEDKNCMYKGIKVGKYAEFGGMSK